MWWTVSHRDQKTKRIVDWMHRCNSGTSERQISWKAFKISSAAWARPQHLPDVALWHYRLRLNVYRRFLKSITVFLFFPLLSAFLSLHGSRPLHEGLERRSPFLIRCSKVDGATDYLWNLDGKEGVVLICERPTSAGLGCAGDCCEEKPIRTPLAFQQKKAKCNVFNFCFVCCLPQSL